MKPFSIFRIQLSTALGLILMSLLSTGIKAEDGSSAPTADTVASWTTLKTVGRPHARHEAAFVQCNDKFFLLGGRGIKPVDIFDPSTGVWTEGARPPMEIHHFQPVVWKQKIILAGAMTGKYPHEISLDRILIYEPSADRWTWASEIPPSRRRGGAGAVIHDGGLYLVCGIQNGHWDGWVPWLDRFDLDNESWETLPNAPRSRDHFQAAVIDGKIYSAGGRRSSTSTKQTFDLTIEEVDVFDVAKNQWSTLPPSSNFPIPRAGTFSFVLGDDLLVAGGESMFQRIAHDEVHALNTETGKWRLMSHFDQGRHGTGIAAWKDNLYTVAGSGGRGGSPELDTTETLPTSNLLME
jgi:N-acetylneuraminic acid mutarotase